MKVRAKCDRCGTYGPESMVGLDCPKLWDPSCCCGTMRRIEIIEHVGLHPNRIENGVLENAFSELWRKENSPDQSMPTLAGILGRHPTQDEATLAATVIQWLGSNVGRCFVSEAHRNATAAAEAYLSRVEE